MLRTFALALVYVFLLTAWLSFVWLIFGPSLGLSLDAHTEAYRVRFPAAPLARTDVTPLAVWRRFDAVHYLNLALAGYSAVAPISTVFNPLAPAAFRLAGVLLSSVDLGALLVSATALGVVFWRLQRLGADYYADPSLGVWTGGVLLALPTAYFLTAPMSDGLYLVLALGAFEAATRKRWIVAALLGALATATRTQGVVLAAVIGIMLLAECATWPSRLRYALAHGWALAAIPLTAFAFMGFRAALALPSITDTLWSEYRIRLTDPLTGLLVNLRFVVTQPSQALGNVDAWALVICLALLVACVRAPRHRRAPLVLYVVCHLLVFTSKINRFGDAEFSQSLARYTLALFPLWFFIADRLRASRRLRLAFFILSPTLLLLFSAVHALGFAAAQ